MLDFDAGRYAIFVWPAYALTGLVFAVLILDSLLRAQRWRRAAEAAKPEAPR
jgi:heme exporter protein D